VPVRRGSIGRGKRGNLIPLVPNTYTQGREKKRRRARGRDRM